MSRWAGKSVILMLAVLLALAGWGMPAMQGSAMTMAHADGGHGHSPATPDQNTADSSCCMLACVPVILSVNSYAKAPLVLTGRVALVATYAVASHRSKPPFHPPRQV